MPEFVLGSGNKLVVSMSPFSDGNELRKSVSRCMTRCNIKEIAKDESVLQLMSDDDVEKWIFVCAKASTYNGIKVNRDLFDDPKLSVQARGDFFEIVSKIMEVNLNPFFHQASSASSIPSPTPE